jgi:type II secretion system protein H
MVVRAKTATSSAGNSGRLLANAMGTPRQKGFTLFELLISMVIMAAIASVVVPQFSRSMTYVQLRKSTQELSAILREARNTAISESRTVALTVEADDQSLQIEGAEFFYQWPDDINVELTSDETSFQKTVSSISFYPDGTSTNSTLTVSAGERSHTIAVDWLTGRVRVL